MEWMLGWTVLLCFRRFFLLRPAASMYFYDGLYGLFGPGGVSDG